MALMGPRELGKIASCIYFRLKWRFVGSLPRHKILGQKAKRTRMHSSRMRTGRALTVSGGGGRVCVHPSRIFLGGGRNWKKKKKKFRYPPPKIWYQTPPPLPGKNLRSHLSSFTFNNHTYSVWVLKMFSITTRPIGVELIEDLYHLGK